MVDWVTFASSTRPACHLLVRPDLAPPSSLPHAIIVHRVGATHPHSIVGHRKSQNPSLNCCWSGDRRFERNHHRACRIPREPGRAIVVRGGCMKTGGRAMASASARARGLHLGWAVRAWRKV